MSENVSCSKKKYTLSVIVYDDMAEWVEKYFSKYFVEDYLYIKFVELYNSLKGNEG